MLLKKKYWLRKGNRRIISISLIVMIILMPQYFKIIVCFKMLMQNDLDLVAGRLDGSHGSKRQVFETMGDEKNE